MRCCSRPVSARTRCRWPSPCSTRAMARPPCRCWRTWSASFPIAPSHGSASARSAPGLVTCAPPPRPTSGSSRLPPMPRTAMCISATPTCASTASARRSKCLVHQPGDALLNFNLGVGLSQAGDIDGAIAQFQKAIALHANYAQAYFSLGNAYRDKKMTAEAVAAYRQATTIEPRFADAFVNLSGVLAEQQDYAEAMAACHRALALAPDHLHALRNLRSEEHTSELQSLMRISYAVFCLKKKK